MFRQLSASTWGFLLGALIMVAMAAGSIAYLRNHTQTTAEVAHVQEVSQSLVVLLSWVENAEAAQRGYLLTGQEPYLQSYRQANQRATETLATLKRQTAGGHPQHREWVRSLERLVAEEHAQLEQAIQARRDRGLEAGVQAMLNQQGKHTLDQIQRVAADLNKDEARELSQQSQHSDRQDHRLALMMLCGAALAVVLVSLAVWRAQRSRRQLARQTEELRETVRLLDLANVLVLDMEGRIIRWNRGAERIYGFTAKEAMGRHSHELLQTRFPEPVEKMRTTLLETGQWEGELIYKRQDGQPVIMASLWVLHRDSQGKPTAILEVNKDITERKRAEEQLQQSERFVQRVLETTPDLIYVYDQIEQRAVYVNREAGTILGYTPEQIKAMGADLFKNILSAEDERSVQKAIKEYGSVKDGQLVEWETQFRCASGEWRWLRGKEMIFTRAPDGTPKQTLGTAEDITDRKRAEEALRESEYRLRLALEGAEMGMWEWDVRANAITCTALNRQMLGLPVDGPMPTMEQYAAAIHPEDMVRLRETWHATVAQNAPYDVEYRVVWPDGSVHWLATKGRPVFDGHGQPVRVLGITMDITQRMQMGEQMREAKEQAERANQAKDQFLAVLSHELRTPLTPVLAVADLLEKDASLHPSIREDAEMIRRNVTLEARLIDDLLDLTRIVRGKIELAREYVDCGTVLHRAVEVCAPDIEARRLHFGVDLQDAPLYLHADASRLEQVFWNLLKNAVKFTPPGGCVGVRSYGENSQAVVEIIDSGVGIEPEALPRIFDAFEQGGVGTTRQFGGLGLGLAISQALVKLHGGTISAFSQGKERGATFRVTLPTVAAASIPGGAVPPMPSAASEKLEGTQRRRGMRILLVEDHGDTARIMRQILRAEGHSVQTAGDVASALELAEKEEFDLIISDLGLPDGSGLDLMRQLRGTDHAIKGIALSGFGREEDVTQSREAGFAEHLTKPVDLGHLDAAIARVAELR